MEGTEYKCVAIKKRKSRKRSFRGTKYTKSQGNTDDMSSEIADQVDGNSCAVISGEQSTSAPAIALSSSPSKINLSYYDSKEGYGNCKEEGTGTAGGLSSSTTTHKTSSNINTNCMYMLTDITIF